MTHHRQILGIQPGQPTSDGAGVRINRVIGGSNLEAYDPFLMFDDFGSSNPDDYVAGFPSHPHRGFETITYMIEGHMRHEDHLGNVGLLNNGGVQWMTAGRGIIHSEMPEQEEGTMRGFQLWLNLPAKDKMTTPGYQDIQPEQLPRLTTDEGIDVTVIAGRFDDGRQRQEGAIQRPMTDPYVIDLHFPAGKTTSPRIPDGHNVMLYVYEGEISLADKTAATIEKGRLIRLSDTGELSISSKGAAKVLLLAGKPLKEPVVQYGPFVMNTREEIEQALRDYRDGTFAA